MILNVLARHGREIFATGALQLNYPARNWNSALFITLFRRVVSLPRLQHLQDVDVSKVDFNLSRDYLPPPDH